MKFDLKSKQTLAGVTALIVAAIAIALNLIVGGLGIGNFRLDLTQDKLYSLSEGTRHILDRINADKPVTLRFYASTENRIMPEMLSNYSKNITDLLLEFEQASGGKVIIEKLAPNPATEDEDKAKEDGLQGEPVNADRENLYLGLAVQCLQQKEVIPFFNPQQETLLEYQIARAISKVSKTSKSVVGVMSTLPVMGSGPQMPFQQQQQGPPAWVVIESLRQDFDVREVATTVDAIDKDIDVLVVLHPTGLEEKTEFALDQFVLRGGKLMAFVDPKSFMAERLSAQQMQNPMMRNQATMINPQSSLKKLFPAWGIGFNDDQVVADMSYRIPLLSPNDPTGLNIPNRAMDKDNRLTKDLQSVIMLTAGTFAVTAKDGLKVTTLMSTSDNAQMISNAEVDNLRRGTLKNFSPENKLLPLAISISGKFKTAFPDGKPKDSGPPKGPKLPGEGGGAQTDATAPGSAPAAVPATPTATQATAAPATPPTAAAPAIPPMLAAPSAPTPAAPTAAVPAVTTAPTPAASGTPDDSLKESKNNEGVVILFGDVDMLYDQLYLQNVGGGFVERASNLSLFLGAVESLSGGGDLISVRNRASTNRPFLKLDALKSEVENRFRPQMNDLTTQLTEAQEKASNLRGKIDKKTQQIIIDPASKADLDKLMATQKDVQKKINEIKKEQRSSIDSTETWITTLNLTVVPLLVIIAGLFLAMQRRATTGAK